MQRQLNHWIRSTCRPSLLRSPPPCTLIASRHLFTRQAPRLEQPGSVLAYSRQDLIARWHASARSIDVEIASSDRDRLEANCIILRADGNIEHPPDPLSKRAVIDEFGLQARDFRSLDAHILDVRPSLFICKRSIVLCTPIVRAIISHDKLVLVGSDPSNPLVSEVHALELVEAIKIALDVVGTTSPFEFRALEALLIVTLKGFKTVSKELQDTVHNALIPKLRQGVSPDRLQELMESKRAVEDMLYSGRALQSAVAAVLSEDEDLAGMFLSDKAKGIVRPIEEHETAELLLEYYERRLDETNEGCLRLSSLLTDVDRNITLVLASTRVRLQNLELQTAITTLSLGAGTATAGFFGMNLISGLESHPMAWYYATGGAIVSMLGIMGIGWIRLLRARRSQLFLGRAEGRLSSCCITHIILTRKMVRDIRISGILFDMDGTLVDSTPAVERTMGEWCALQGLVPAEFFLHSHGVRTRDNIRRHQLDPPGASLSEEELNAASDKLELLIAENGRLIQQAGGRGITALPGAIAFLQRLSMLGANFGIVTSATKGYATSALETSGVTEAVKIPFVVTAGDCVHGKPHPEPYLRGVERLKEVAGGEVNAEDVLVFEDAPSGITSGLKAGCRTLAVCTSHSRERIEGLESTYKVVDLERVEVVSVEKGHMTLRLKELHEE